MIDVSGSFPNLDGAWHLVHYLPYTHGRDALSRALVAFKNGVRVDAWSESMVKNVPSINYNVDVIVRVLSSSETSASSNTPIDTVGVNLAKVLQAQYLPNTLLKTRPTKPLHTLGSKNARQDELRGVYFVNPALNLINDGDSIMIIDDILTTGTTIEFIAEELKKKYPCSKLYAVGLGHTTYNVDANKKFYKK